MILLLIVFLSTLAPLAACKKELPTAKARIPAQKRPGFAVEVKGVPGARMVWIPPGVFLMGSPKSEAAREANEDPRTRVRLTRGFWLWRTELTQKQFARVMGYNPSKYRGCGPSCPVERINWHEAAACCNSLSRLAGLERCFDCRGKGPTVNCRLRSPYRKNGARGYYRCRGFGMPTEAEWEYAARAGTTGDRYGPLDEIAWHRTSGVRSNPTGRKRPNAWGLHDIIGNVYEWCWDWYHPRYPGGTVTDPVGPPKGTARVRRGAGSDRAAQRGGHTPLGGYDGLGMRPCRTG